MIAAARRAARTAAANRWLSAAIVAMLLATATLDAGTGSSGSGRQLLGGSVASSPEPSERTDDGSTEASPSGPLDPFGPQPAGVPAPAVLSGGAAPDEDVSPALPPVAPASPGAPEEAPSCPGAPALDALAAAQEAVEGSGGQPLPVDVSGLVATSLGCDGGGAAANPLDALGAIGQLLDGLGIPSVPLPPPPELPLPPAPPGFEALGPVVLPVCADVIQQLVTVAAVAPVARLDIRQVVALFDPLIAVCALFAPRT